jgi:phosphatidylserine synthase
MKYIADVLTSLRVVAAVLIVIAVLQDMWMVALIVLIIGILSDAFDGIAARKWPYTAEENATKWWRKDPHAFDNMADLALSGAALLSLTVSLLSLWQVLIICAVVGLVSFVIQTIVDHVGPRNRIVAERIDVAHGWLFGAELTAYLVIMTMQATPNWKTVVVLYALAALPLVWLKWDRITSRSELTYGATS